MNTRIGRCVTCGGQTVAGKRGPIPKYCETCRHARRLESSQGWKDRNRDDLNAARRAQWVADDVATQKAKERHRRWYEANRERVAKYRRQLYREQQAVTNTAAVAAYRLANPGKHAEIENRRRARLVGQFVEAVDPAAIRLRDEGLCGICGLVVAVDKQSLDHIMPIALGGTHEPTNVQLAHRRCNSRKGVQLLDGAGSAGAFPLPLVEPGG